MSQFLPTVPTPRDFSNPLLELREKKVAEWCDSLPLHEAPEAIDQVLQALAPLNLEPLAEKVRVRLLALYQPPIQRLHDDWTLLQRKTRDLQPAQQLEVKERLAELLWQLATGYKIVVRNMKEQGLSATKEPQLQLSLYRAIETLCMVLINAYRNYAAIPPHAYRELNQLYEFAVQQGVADALAPIDKKHMTEQSPESLYKRALLLAAADPFRLPQGEVDQLQRLLAQFADRCTLQRPPWRHTRGRFLVSAEEDRSPTPCSKLKRAGVSEASWVLDTNPLQEAAQKYIDASGESERSSKELTLLRRILPDLKEPPKRRSARTSSEKELRVSVGLTATHHFLSSAGAARLQQTATNAAYGIEVHDAESESHVSYLLEPWKVVNESPKGYMLARRHALDESLQVGEALGLFPMHSPEARRAAEIGVIRWIKRSAENWTHIGVEVLPGRPDAIQCEPIDPGEYPFEEPRALFLNRISNTTVPPTLLGRSGLYRKECSVTLKREGHRGQARIGSLIMETSHLVRITLKPVQ